jgi:hypothetical protein
MSLNDARCVLGVDSAAGPDEIRRAYKAACFRFHPDRNRDAPEEAERMFQEVQLAFSMLTVNAESIEALEATETFISKLPTPAAALPRKPTSGVKKIRIGDGVLFIGDIREGQPHGVGELILKDGSVHHGTFDRGRAEGLGILYMANGSVFRGNWAQNKRTGAFEVIDPNGGRWHDLYDEDGKRVRRTQALIKAVEAAAVAVEAARVEAAAAEARAAQAKVAVAAAEAAVMLALAQPPPLPSKLSVLRPAEVQATSPGFKPSPEYRRLTAEQRQANAERRRLAGAAIRAEQRRQEGGGFAGVVAGAAIRAEQRRQEGGGFAGVVAGAAIRAEQRRQEGGGFAGVGSPTGGLSPQEFAEATAAAASAAAQSAPAVPASAPSALSPGLCTDATPSMDASLFTDGLFTGGHALSTATPSAAIPCCECGVRFHPGRVSRCRRHHMEWMPVPLPVDWNEWPEGGLWSCCGGMRKAAEGCALGWHVAIAGECRGDGEEKAQLEPAPENE